MGDSVNAGEQVLLLAGPEGIFTVWDLSFEVLEGSFAWIPAG